MGPGRAWSISEQFQPFPKKRGIKKKEGKKKQALAGVAQWIECQPMNQRVTGSIPSLGTHLGCGLGPQSGVCERQPHIDVKKKK